MNCFNEAVSVVLAHEGGFSDHPSDPGGATNFGISLRWLQAQGLYGDFNDDGNVDIDDLLYIDHAKAVQVYRDKWWDKYHYDRFNDCAVATKVFDMSVNMGGRQAHKILQRALNLMGEVLTIDGIIGPKTMIAANTADQDSLVEALRAEQKKFYTLIIAHKPSLAIFRKGWMRRAEA